MQEKHAKNLPLLKYAFNVRHAPKNCRRIFLLRQLMFFYITQRSRQSLRILRELSRSVLHIWKQHISSLPAEQTQPAWL